MLKLKNFDGEIVTGGGITMELYNGKILAEIPGEKYIYYPNISSQKLSEEQEKLEKSLSNTRITIYNIGDEDHLEDYRHWKKALENRTMTFKRSGFVFNSENIRQLQPTGFIVLIRQ